MRVTTQKRLSSKTRSCFASSPNAASCTPTTPRPARAGSPCRRGSTGCGSASWVGHIRPAASPGPPPSVGTRIRLGRALLAVEAASAGRRSPSSQPARVVDPAGRRGRPSLGPLPGAGPAAGSAVRGEPDLDRGQRLARLERRRRGPGGGGPGSWRRRAAGPSRRASLRRRSRLRLRDRRVGDLGSIERHLAGERQRGPLGGPSRSAWSASGRASPASSRPARRRSASAIGHAVVAAVGVGERPTASCPGARGPSGLLRPMQPVEFEHGGRRARAGSGPVARAQMGSGCPAPCLEPLGRIGRQASASRAREYGLARPRSTASSSPAGAAGPASAPARPA